MTPFNGFSNEAIEFLKQLRENNNKEWWEAHKQTYIEQLQEPALALVESVGQKLESIVPNICYDTRTNGSGSLMRPYRDTRFSEDKTPYKTNVAMMWWEGSGKKTEQSAFGFQLSLESSGLMAGIHGFDKQTLEAYREAVDDDRLGGELQAAIEQVMKSGDYTVGEPSYKRVPRGYSDDHPRADLLKYGALYVHHIDIPLEIVQSPDFDEYCFQHFKNMAPIQTWLAKVINQKA